MVGLGVVLIIAGIISGGLGIWGKVLYDNEVSRMGKGAVDFSRQLIKEMGAGSEGGLEYFCLDNYVLLFILCAVFIIIGIILTKKGRKTYR